MRRGYHFPMLRRLLLIAAALALLTAAGFALAPSARAEADAAMPANSPIPALLAAIDNDYALPVVPYRLENATLDGMLHSLDPHSNYYDPPTYTRMNEDQEGHFSGVGLLVNKRKREPVLIMAPVRGTPGFRAGILAGDTIEAIDGVTTLPLDGDEVVDRLRGDTGTLVKLMMGRPGREKSIEVTLKRTEIPKSSITLASKVGETALVRVSSFGATTAQDLRTAVQNLGGTNLRGLVLDLRGNPGGRLSAAIEMASLFLRRGQTVLEVRGRQPEQNEIHKVTADGPFLTLPLVILIDHESASASEVVTGALQDHDRAVVVGEVSWGKGLVQTIYPLYDWHAALALTTAKYYTPSGRLIQKSFGNSYDEYYLDETGSGSDSVKDYHTDHARSVKGGGGITPDVMAKQGTVGSVPEWLDRDRRLFHFALKKMDMTAGGSWVAGDDDVAALKAYLLGEKVKIDDKVWNEQIPYIRASLTREVRLISAFPNESAAAMLRWDPVAKAAFDHLAEATTLLAEFQIPDKKAA